MEKTRKTLLALFAGFVAAAALIVALFELDVLEIGVAAADPSQGEVLYIYMVELGTIAAIPVTLRLFKFKRVEADLHARHAEALRRWGALRIAMLGSVLVLNALSYYLLMNTSLGYLAIIAALCLPFVYPSKEKCVVEAGLDVDADTEE